MCTGLDWSWTRHIAWLGRAHSSHVAMSLYISTSAVLALQLQIHLEFYPSPISPSCPQEYPEKLCQVPCWRPDTLITLPKNPIGRGNEISQGQLVVAAGLLAVTAFLSLSSQIIRHDQFCQGSILALNPYFKKHLLLCHLSLSLALPPLKWTLCSRSASQCIRLAFVIDVLMFPW